MMEKIDSVIINAVAPEQIRNKDFSKTFAKILKRPHFLFIPVFALKALYGGFAKEISISQKIKSEVPNFDFRFKNITNTLQDIG